MKKKLKITAAILSTSLLFTPFLDSVENKADASNHYNNYEGSYCANVLVMEVKYARIDH